MSRSEPATLREALERIEAVLRAHPDVVAASTKDKLIEVCAVALADTSSSRWVRLQDVERVMRPLLDYDTDDEDAVDAARAFLDGAKS